MRSESTAKTRDKDRRREGIRMMVPKAARVLTENRRRQPLRSMNETFRRYDSPSDIRSIPMSSRPLDVLQIAKPCHMPWEQMRGDEQRRFCNHCQRHVHDLAAMTLSDAERLICQSAGQACIRLTRMPDGRVKTLDYQPRPRRSNRMIWALLAPLGAAALSVGAVIWGRPARTATVTAGMICPPALTTAPPNSASAPPPSENEPGDIQLPENNPRPEKAQ